MKVALPVWNSRISPLFDVARRVVLAELDGGKEAARREEAISEAFPPRKVSRLQELGVQVLICGGITWQLAQLVEASGIKLIPCVAGSVSEVLEACLAGNLSSSRFFIPGVRGREVGGLDCEAEVEVGNGERWSSSAYELS